MNNFITAEAVNIDNLTKEEIIKKIEEYEKISSEDHLVLFLPCSAKAELNEKESKKVLSIFTMV